MLKIKDMPTQIVRIEVRKHTEDNGVSRMAIRAKLQAEPEVLTGMRELEVVTLLQKLGTACEEDAADASHTFKLALKRAFPTEVYSFTRDDVTVQATCEVALTPVVKVVGGDVQLVWVVEASVSDEILVELSMMVGHNDVTLTTLSAQTELDLDGKKEETGKPGLKRRRGRNGQLPAPPPA